jgi:hypothetical protein
VREGDGRVAVGVAVPDVDLGVDPRGIETPGAEGEEPAPRDAAHPGAEALPERGGEHVPHLGAGGDLPVAGGRTAMGAINGFRSMAGHLPGRAGRTADGCGRSPQPN